MRTSFVLLLSFGLAGATASAAGVVSYSTLAAWTAATTGVTTIDFSTVQPPSGLFNRYSSPPGLTLSGVNFSTLGNTPVDVVNQSYCCATYQRGYDSADDNASGFKATLPAGTTAFGFYLFTVVSGNPGGTNQDNVNVTVNGQMYTVTTLPAPGLAFFGLVSTTPLSSFTITPQQTGRQINLVNFAFGQGLATPPEGVPLGSMDTPATNTTNAAGAVNVTGWAISLAGIATIGIWRDPVSGETPSSNGLVFLANAAQIPGARPDVAKAFPNYPNNNWGWGVQVLTNELPGTNGLPLGNGTYTFHALAVDNDGFSGEIGNAIISANNTASNLPFGTIDTPTQGGIASGTAFINFGWALTKNPASIPVNGSTIYVFIDNLPVGHPVYNNYRADIATLFPGLANSNGAVGYFIFDTTKYTNGLHTIAWSATDSAGNTSGLGSRFFIVQNP